MPGGRGFVVGRAGLAKLTAGSSGTAPAKFPPDVVRLGCALQGIFINVVEEVFLTLDLKLSVFFVTEALIIVDGDFQLITHSFEFLVEE